MLEEKDFLRKEKEFLKIYPANRENLQEIVRDLEEYGKSVGLSTRQNYFINLIIEELVVNVIMMADSGRNRSPYVDVRVFQDEEGASDRTCPGQSDAVRSRGVRCRGSGDAAEGLPGPGTDP